MKEINASVEISYSIEEEFVDRSKGVMSEIH